MAIVSNTVNYLDGDVLLEGYFAFDDSIQGQRPVVLINHAWAGRDGFVEEKAKQIAELGYVGFAVDMYGKGILGISKDQNAQLMQPFMEDRQLIIQRMKAVFNAIRLMPWVDDKQIAAMGFCFGGLCVLDFARTGIDIKGVISFHGLLGAPQVDAGSVIKAKVLAMHGYDDPMVPVVQVNVFQEEMTRAGADWQFHSFGNTMHAFTNPVANDPDFGTVYQVSADQRSWKLMVSFLNEIFTSV
ncbi:MAG: dienelactone hydrolase family protein [Methylococcales bacterium]|nr:dienelactone hydrolase family protein [Methylococcales bacterium]